MGRPSPFIFTALQLTVHGVILKSCSRMLCSKCGNEERIPGQRWGRNCFATYQKGYYSKSRELLAHRSKKAGAAAMRSELARMFQGIGLKELNCVTIAEMIRRADIDV